MKAIFNPEHEVKFIKSPDERMKGTIQMTNPTSQSIFAFKIKCTNPDLFHVHPLKGTLRPSESISIQFETNDPVNMQYAKELNSLANFKSQQAQKKKLYINMDSIRGSKVYQDHDKISMHSGISNKMSYISMKNQTRNPKPVYITPLKAQEPIVESPPHHQDLHIRYEKLKQDYEVLVREREKIMGQVSQAHKTSSISLKKIAVFVIFLIIGVFLGGFIKTEVKKRNELIQLQQKRIIKEKQGWFSSIFDFLYDQIDATEEIDTVKHDI